jgi:hypothetical protein
MNRAPPLTPPESVLVQADESPEIPLSIPTPHPSPVEQPNLQLTVPLQRTTDQPKISHTNPHQEPRLTATVPPLTVVPPLAVLLLAVLLHLPTRFGDPTAPRAGA